MREVYIPRSRRPSVASHLAYLVAEAVLVATTFGSSITAVILIVGAFHGQP